MEESDVFIQPMQENEKKSVRKIMNRSFPLVQRWFFSFTPDVLVAVLNEKVIGAIVLKRIPLPGKRKGGLMYWGFVDPDVRGMKIGLKLYKAGIEYLENLGCDEILGCVEGNNTSSSNILAANGFSIMSLGQQIQRYGIGIVPLWFRIFHYIDIGHFLWVRPRTEKTGSSSWQWWGNVLINILVFSLASWTGFHFTNLRFYSVIPLFILLFLGVRAIAMRIAAKLCGLSVRYRAWESGFPLSFVLALISGIWYPIPGSVYPTSNQWRYRDLTHKLGPIALAGAFSILLLTWGLSAFFHSLPSEMAFMSYFIELAGKPLLIFDIMLPFFPFVSYDGRRIWDWNRIIWVVTAVAAGGVVWFG